MPFLNDPNSSSSLADGPGKKKNKTHVFKKLKPEHQLTKSKRNEFVQ